MEDKNTIVELFNSKQILHFAAPMVRYSKLPFRLLVHDYDCDVTYTPMIIAESFIKSEKAMKNEFSTVVGHGPLITQFASRNGEDFSLAAELVSPYCEGVDLNCGCPQRWAAQEGYGACLSHNPDLVSDIIRQTRQRLPSSKSISIKIRLCPDISETVELCRRAEKTGVSFIAVHGRTRTQRYEPVSYDAIRCVKDALSIPVVANGDVTCLADVDNVATKTGVNGVMIARGLLSNPALFRGFSHTPNECIENFLNLCFNFGTSYTFFHHILMRMLESQLCKSQRRYFNALTCMPAVLDFLHNEVL